MSMSTSMSSNNNNNNTSPVTTTTTAAAAAAATAGNNNPDDAATTIQSLPKEVVDRIAAGEVVQRPSSVVKELIENCLDAQSSKITVQVLGGGIKFLSVTDNGKGMSRADLTMAAQRFATSKLVSTNDLKHIQSFGFRGEALASVSMVSRLTITSRMTYNNTDSITTTTTTSSSSSSSLSTSSPSSVSHCAYKMQYRDGAPLSKKAQPSAGMAGTTVTVQDLFYNTPHRLKAFSIARKESEEYNRILQVLQKYAIHNASKGVGFVCRKKGGSTDLNTVTIPSLAEGGSRATKDVMAHIYGAKVIYGGNGNGNGNLLELTCGVGNVEKVALASVFEKEEEEEKMDNNNNNNKKSNYDKFSSSNDGGNINDDSDDTDDFAFRAHGYISSASSSSTGASSSSSNKSSSSSPGLILFVNHRLVESAPMKRALEQVYAKENMMMQSSSSAGSSSSSSSNNHNNKNKPFFLMYVSIHLPGPQVDVNVHPTKREVAYIYMDRLVEHLVETIRTLLSASRTFSTCATTTTSNSNSNSSRVSANTKSKSDVLGGSQSLKLATTARNTPKKTATTTTTTATTITTRTKSATVTPVSLKKQPPSLKRKTEGSDSDGDYDNDDDDNYDDCDMATNDGEGGDVEEEGSSGSKKRAPTAAASMGSFSNKRKKTSTTANTNNPFYNPSKLIRTSTVAPAGALEPFLVRQQDKNNDNDNTTTTTTTPSSSSPSSLAASKERNRILLPVPEEHKEDCEFRDRALPSAIDMSLPGAFASICRCQVKYYGGGSIVLSSSPGRKNTNATKYVRPKKVVPTACSFTSIQQLRASVAGRLNKDLAKKLRDATYVGTLSRRRCLVQYGVELLMLNHYELARELFYQLALARFGGGAPRAKLAVPIRVRVVMEQALQFAEFQSTAPRRNDRSCEVLYSNSDSNVMMEVSDTNRDLAEQATRCLAEHAEMLNEYFSIDLEKEDTKSSNTTSDDGGNDNEGDSDDGELVLKALPVLLDGYCPQPHALPLFLLRLTTEVNYSDETICFDAVCSELGAFYAEVPLEEEEAEEEATAAASTSQRSSPAKSLSLLSSSSSSSVESTVAHALFPALRFLLVPPNDLGEGCVTNLALLSSLYKVFERC